MSSGLIAWILTAAAFADSCEEPTTNAQVAASLETAMSAYEATEPDDLEAAVVDSRNAVRCLGEALTPAMAAELHRVLGLNAFVQRRENAAQRQFAAARRIEPGYVLPESIVPRGNPAEVLYQARDPDEGPKVALPPPREGVVRLDGSTDLTWNSALPVVFQRFDGDGTLVATELLQPGDDLPEYDASNGPPRTKGGGGSGAKRALLISGAGSLVAAGAMYGAALGTKQSFANQSELGGGADPDQLTRTFRTNRMLVVTSAGLGVVGLGLGGSSFALTGSF